jgi:transposase
MRIKSLIQPLIGTDDFVYQNCEVDANNHIITFSVQIPKHLSSRCGICSKRVPKYDQGTEKRQWRALNQGYDKAYIVCDTYRVACPKHGVVTCAVPWATHASRFCKAFEQEITWLATQMSKSALSILKKISWRTVGEICNRTYLVLRAKAPSPFDHLVNIGIDETSYKKGHKYLTVVVNHDTNAVIWCHVGYGKEILKQFFEALKPEQLQNIQCISADGARFIQDCIETYCPNAERCVDPFHVVSWATEVLDDLRKEEWHLSNQKAKQAPKRGKGRPKKGESVNPERQQAQAIKGMRYPLLKGEENLTTYQRQQLDYLAKADPKLHRAYLLKESLRLAVTAPAWAIEEELKTWMKWAQRCQIPAFRKLRKKIKRHYSAIIASARNGISNARIEATNNKIKLIIKRAYGFRNNDNMLALIMLNCSAVKPILPGM